MASEGDLFSKIFRFLTWEEVCRAAQTGSGAEATGYSASPQNIAMMYSEVNLYLVEGVYRETPFTKVGLTVWDDILKRDEKAYKKVLHQERVRFEHASLYEGYAIFDLGSRHFCGHDQVMLLHGFNGATEAVPVQSDGNKDCFVDCIERMRKLIAAGRAIDYLCDGYLASLIGGAASTTFDAYRYLLSRTPYILKQEYDGCAFKDVIASRGMPVDHKRLTNFLMQLVGPLREATGLASYEARVDLAKKMGWAYPGYNEPKQSGYAKRATPRRKRKF